MPGTGSSAGEDAGVQGKERGVERGVGGDRAARMRVDVGPSL